MTLFHNDQLLVVANSNRFEAVDSKGDTNMAILDVRNPAAVTVLKTIQPTPPNSLNSFPRDITLGPDGSTLYVPNNCSNFLEVIRTFVSN
jgi:DNA-binding beta-propeller fold protein YncE